MLQKCRGYLKNRWKDKRGSKQRQVRHDTWMTILSRTQMMCNLEPRVMKFEYVWCNSVRFFLWVCCSPTPSVGWRFFPRQPKPVLKMKKITTCQGLQNPEKPSCSSSTGPDPASTTMTKLLASWPASLTQISASFSATVCSTCGRILCGQGAQLFRGSARGCNPRQKV